MSNQDESLQLPTSPSHRPTRRRPDKELRRLMQKFDELTQNSIALQNVFIKMWKLLVKTQHRDEFLAQNKCQNPIPAGTILENMNAKQKT